MDPLLVDPGLNAVRSIMSFYLSHFFQCDVPSALGRLVKESEKSVQQPLEKLMSALLRSVAVNRM